MGLCEVLASLADAVAAKYNNRSGWHNLLIPSYARLPSIETRIDLMLGTRRFGTQEATKIHHHRLLSYSTRLLTWVATYVRRV
jgi:hypothetical protein